MWLTVGVMDPNLQTHTNTLMRTLSPVTLLGLVLVLNVVTLYGINSCKLILVKNYFT